MERPAEPQEKPVIQLHQGSALLPTIEARVSAHQKRKKTSRPRKPQRTRAVERRHVSGVKKKKKCGPVGTPLTRKDDGTKKKKKGHKQRR